MRLVALILLIFCGFHSFSQDHIYTTGHDTIDAKILEVSKHKVSFKDLNDKSGDVLSVRKHNIWKVEYADGSSEVFNDHSVWSETIHAVSGAVVDISRVTWQAMLSAEHYMEDRFEDLKDNREEKKRQEAEEAEKARIQAIADAEARKKAEAELQRKQAEESKHKAEEEARRKAEEEARKKAEAEARRKEEEARQKALEEERKKALLAKDLSVEEQIQKQKEHEAEEDKKEQVVKEVEIPLPKKKEKRQNYEHHSDDHAETAEVHSAHADPSVSSRYHKEAKKFVHHKHGNKDGLGPVIRNFAGRNDTYDMPLKPEKQLSPLQEKLLKEFFYTNKEIDKYITEDQIRNYHAFYLNYEDFGLDTLSDEELKYLAAWTRFYTKKKAAFEAFRKKNPGQAGKVYIPNLTYLDLSYTYKAYRSRKKYRSDGTEYYYVDYKVWVYVRNSSSTTYTYKERYPIARMNFRNNKAKGEWFRMRPKKVGESKWAIAPGEVLSKMHMVSVKQNSPGASASGPTMKEWDVVFAGPKVDQGQLDDIHASILKRKTLRTGLLAASSKSYYDLKHELPLVREYTWRNHVAKAEMSEDSKTSLYVFYSFNKFTRDFKDAGSRAIDDAPMHMEIYLNGTYVGPIKKGEVVRVELPKGGKYNVLLQKRKSKLKKEQYSAKNITLADGETQYL